MTLEVGSYYIVHIIKIIFFILFYLIILIYFCDSDNEDNEDDSGLSVEWDLGTVRGPGVMKLAQSHNTQEDTKLIQNGGPMHKDSYEVSFD